MDLQEKKYNITKENAAEMQAKGVEAKKRAKTAREVLREELNKKVGDMTKLEYLTKKVINNSVNDITWKDLKIMHELLGEFTSNVSVETKKPEDVIKEIMDAIR